MRKATLVIFAVLGLLVVACGEGSSALGDGDELTISMFEYEFEPSEIVLKAGTTVTLVLMNEGGTDHELMAGREVRMEDGVPHGFETDFFDTVDDLVIDPPDALETEMEGMGDESMGDMSSTTMGDMSGTTMGDMSDDEHMDMGVMIAREPTESARITFTLTEDSVGEWDFGCFEEEGTHWEQGMRGTITVEEA